MKSKRTKHGEEKENEGNEQEELDREKEGRMESRGEGKKENMEKTSGTHLITRLVSEIQLGKISSTAAMVGLSRISLEKWWLTRFRRIAFSGVERCLLDVQVPQGVGMLAQQQKQL